MYELYLGGNMGLINKLWDENPSSISEMKLKQIIVLAGDGNLNHKRTYEELRQFFTKIDASTMLKFIDESLSVDKEDKFDDRGFVLQDLVNEIGRRLGYKVTNGLYRGKRNDENGYDGLWECPDGSHIIMESKTSDAYSLNLDALEGYREELIEAKIIERKRSSVLIVLGRSDKGDFPSLVRGSVYSQNIRIISTRALFEVLVTYENSKSPIVQGQIMQLLKPHDFMQLDNLVELVFPQTDKNIPDCGAEKSQEVTEVPRDNRVNVEIPELPDINLKVGKFIKQAMTNLSESGYRFSEEQLKRLSSKEWSNKTFGINYPFLKYYNPEETKGHYLDGYQRFYADIFTFGTLKVYITKELFDKTKNRFIEWYKLLKADQ